MGINATDRQYLVTLADELDNAKRQGEEKDLPEGKRFITLSDTLAKRISARVRKIAGGGD